MTYNVPSITKEPMKVAAMMYRHTKPISNVLLGVIAAHGLVTALVTYKETKSFLHIQEKLNEMERRIEEIQGLA